MVRALFFPHTKWACFGDISAALFGHGQNIFQSDLTWRPAHPPRLVIAFASTSGLGHMRGPATAHQTGRRPPAEGLTRGSPPAGESRVCRKSGCVENLGVSKIWVCRKSGCVENLGVSKIHPPTAPLLHRTADTCPRTEPPPWPALGEPRARPGPLAVNLISSVGSMVGGTPRGLFPPIVQDIYPSVRPPPAIRRPAAARCPPVCAARALGRTPPPTWHAPGRRRHAAV